MISLHVDDLLGAGDEEFQKVMVSLRTRFKFSDTKEGSFVHLGMRVRQEGTGMVTFSQEEYVDQIQPVLLEPEGESGQDGEGVEEEGQNDEEPATDERVGAEPATEEQQRTCEGWWGRCCGSRARHDRMWPWTCPCWHAH